MAFARNRGCDDMGKIIMIGAMKGGVGKSVTAFNLAYSLQMLDSAEGRQTNTNKKGTSSILKRL